MFLVDIDSTPQSAHSSPPKNFRLNSFPVKSSHSFINGRRTNERTSTAWRDVAGLGFVANNVCPIMRTPFAQFSYDICVTCLTNNKPKMDALNRKLSWWQWGLHSESFSPARKKISAHWHCNSHCRETPVLVHHTNFDSGMMRPLPISLISVLLYESTI